MLTALTAQNLVLRRIHKAVPPAEASEPTLVDCGTDLA